MKKNFTLIELIVVIAVLGILASIIVPNISNIQGKATTTAIVANVKNLQTAVDMYAVQNEELPGVGTATAVLPQPIDFTKIYPEVVRSLPKGKDVRYWIDVNGEIWASKVDAPKVTSTSATNFSWEKVTDAVNYQVYEVQYNKTQGALLHGSVSYKKVSNGFKNKDETTFVGEEGKVYTVSAFDKDGFESASVGSLDYEYTDTLESAKNGQSGSQVPNPSPTPDPTPSNEIPVVTITGLSGSLTDQTVLDYTYAASDSDGTVVAHEWRIDGTVVTTPPSKLSAGTHLIEIRVQDNSGAWSEWASKSVIVVAQTVVTKMIAGIDNTFVLLSNGTVQGWGYNPGDPLGVGDTNLFHPTPSATIGLSNVKELSSNGWNSFALLNDGTVKSWGNTNQKGALGLGDTDEHSTPTTVSGLTNVKQIVLGAGESGMALLNDGTVKAWGNNGDYQLGLGDTTNRTSPTTIPGLSDVKQLSLATNHAMALLNDGTVKVWGSNYTGQLGFGDSGMNAYRSTPTTLPSLTNVKQILAVNNDMSLALMNDGTVKTWGWNINGMLGLGSADTTNKLTPTTIPDLTNVRELVSGINYMYAILNDGTVKVWGFGNTSRLGLGDTLTVSTPTLIPGLTNVKSISAGRSHSVATLNDGTFKVWGSNTYHQLGLGDTTERKTPTTLNFTINE